MEEYISPKIKLKIKVLNMNPLKDEELSDKILECDGCGDCGDYASCTREVCGYRGHAYMPNSVKSSKRSC